MPPSSAYRSSTGRRCYALRVKFLEASLRGEIEKAVLIALEARLERDDRNLPEPRTKPAEPDRVELALRAAAENLDAKAAGSLLLSRVHEVLKDPNAEDREQRRAVRLFMRLYALNLRTVLAAFKAM